MNVYMVIYTQGCNIGGDALAAQILWEGALAPISAEGNRLSARGRASHNGESAIGPGAGLPQPLIGVGKG